MAPDEEAIAQRKELEELTEKDPELREIAELLKESDAAVVDVRRKNKELRKSLKR